MRGVAVGGRLAEIGDAAGAELVQGGRHLALRGWRPYRQTPFKSEAFAALSGLADEYRERGEMRVDRFRALDQRPMADGDFEVLGDAVGGEAFGRPLLILRGLYELRGQFVVEFNRDLLYVTHLPSSESAPIRLGMEFGEIPTPAQPCG